MDEQTPEISTSISVYMNETERNALKILAAGESKPIARLVRDALDNLYGEQWLAEIERIQAKPNKKKSPKNN